MTAYQHTRAIVVSCALACAQIACMGPLDGDRPFARDQIVDSPATGDVMRAGERVSVEAEVKGDVAAAGRDVSVSAPVGGYVMGAGRNVTVTGAIGNDAWLAGEVVRVGGRVESNAMLAGRDVELASGASFGDDVRIGANHVRTEATIERNLIVGASVVEIGGNIGGTVRANARRVTLLPGTVIHGDFVVRAQERPVVPPDARVIGTVLYTHLDQRSWAMWPFYFIAAFLALLVLGLVTLACFPAWIARVSDTMKTHVASSIFSGLLVVILTPIVVGVLLVTVVGIPLAVVLGAMFVATMVTSTVFVEYRIGHWLLERRRRPGISAWGSVTLGALIVALAVTLPVVGWAIGMVVMLIGAGALVIERRSWRRRAPASLM